LHQQPAADRLAVRWLGIVSISQLILSPVRRWTYCQRPFHEGGVMDWLDALIESAMAFAKDVKPQSISDLAPVVRTAEQALGDTSKPMPLPAAIMPMNRATSERDEILQRVSNFRAHQEKMAREREDYYLQVKAKMLAPVDPNPALVQADKTVACRSRRSQDID
jgi:hypothetical protein